MSERDVEANRLLIAVFYEGPWERVMNWLWYLGPGQTYRDVRVGGIRDRLAGVAADLHQSWVRRHEQNPEGISDRWKRSGAPAHPESPEGADTDG